MFKKYEHFIKYFLYGSLGGLAFAPFYGLFLIPISFYFLIHNILKQKNIKIVIKYSLTYSLGFFLIQLYWISFSLFVDFKNFFWLFPFALLLIPFVCGCFLSISIILFYKIANYYELNNKFLITILFSFLYVMIEFLRYFLFPWNLFSYIIGFSTILMQIVYILNIHLLSFLLIIFLCFPYVLFEYKNKKIYFCPKYKYYSIYYIIFPLILLFYGYFRLQFAENKQFNLNIRIIQANIKQNLKINTEEYYNNFKKHIDMTISKPLDDIDLIVWPESSIPFTIIGKDLPSNDFNNISNKILITGGLRATLDKNYTINNAWNSIFFIKNKHIFDYYDKNKLVPFGEYIPLFKYIPFVKKIIGNVVDFSKGVGNKTITINGLFKANLNGIENTFKISPLICYEIAFINNIYNKNEKPDLILNLTNDAWFGYSSGPFQHFIMAKFRAIENKIPVLRVVNNGISAYIDEYGRIKYKTKLNTTTTLDIHI